MNFKHLKIFGLSLLVPTLTICSQAFADCSDMGSDQWNEMSAKMSQAYQSGNYEEAIKYGKSLTLICDKSPVANFIMSMAYGQLGRDTEGYTYILKATEYMREYTVPDALTEKIWLRRAEYELPYKNQVAELKAQLEAKDLEMTNALAADNEASTATLSASWEEYQNNMETLMWTGTGIAIGGAVIAIIGGSIGGYYESAANKNLKKIYAVADGNKKSSDFNDFGRIKHDYAEYNNLAKGGYATLGIGLGLGVAGAVTAVISYLKIDTNKDGLLKEQNKTENNTASFSFNVSTTSLELGITF